MNTKWRSKKDESSSEEESEEEDSDAEEDEGQGSGAAAQSRGRPGELPPNSSDEEEGSEDESESDDDDDDPLLNPHKAAPTRRKEPEPAGASTPLTPRLNPFPVWHVFSSHPPPPMSVKM